MAKGKGIGDYLKYHPISIGYNVSKNISKKLANSPLRYAEPSLALAHEIKKRRSAKTRSSSKPGPIRKRPSPSKPGPKKPSARSTSAKYRGRKK